MKANRHNPFPPTALSVLLATALLAACAVPQPPTPAPLPAALPPPAAPAPPPPPPPADWRDAPRTPGNWRWDVAQGNEQAVYGPAVAPPLVKLICDRAAGEVVLARNATDGGSADAVPMALITTSISRALISEPPPSTPSWLVVAFAAGDPILDAMAYSRGRFALETAALPTLYLPSWPEVSRVIEACR